MQRADLVNKASLFPGHLQNIHTRPGKEASSLSVPRQARRQDFQEGGYMDVHVHAISMQDFGVGGLGACFPRTLFEILML